MDINGKLKIIFILIAAVSMTFSACFTVNKHSGTETKKTIGELQAEAQERSEFEDFTASMRNEADVDAVCASYISLCESTQDLDDTVKVKKSELAAETELLKTSAAEVKTEIEKIYNSEALPISERMEMLSQSEKYKQMKAHSDKCASLKIELDSAVEQYNKAQEERKKAEEAARISESQNKSSSSSSQSNSSVRRSYSDDYDDSGYSGSYSSGGSSYSSYNSYNSYDSYSSSDSYDTYDSSDSYSSGADLSDGGGSYEEPSYDSGGSDEGLGSER